MNNRYSKTYPITLNMLDGNHILLPSAIFDIVQDVSSRHSDIMNAGYKVAFEKGIAWILIRAKYDVIKYPDYLEDVVAETWPLKPGRVDLDRNTVIKSKDGETLIKIIEKWVLVDINTRRILPSRVLNELANFHDDQIIFDEPFNKVCDYECDQYLSDKVVATQIDHNMHLNNTRYTDMMYNALIKFDKSLFKRTIKSFEIEFNKENKYDAILNIGVISITENEKFVKILNANNEISSKALIKYNK